MGERFEPRKHGYGWAVFDTTTGKVVSGEYAKHYDAENRAELMSREARKKRRPCLRCRTPFMSEGAHNRLCDGCRSGVASDDWMSRLIG